MNYNFHFIPACLEYRKEKPLVPHPKVTITIYNIQYTIYFCKKIELIILYHINRIIKVMFNDDNIHDAVNLWCKKKNKAKKLNHF